MIIGILIGYAVVAFVHGLFALFLFALESNGYGREEESVRRYATWLLATPFWPILYIKGLMKLIINAKDALAEGKKEEK